VLKGAGGKRIAACLFLYNKNLFLNIYAVEKHIYSV